MRASGRAVHPDDLPPDLLWEGAVWWLYLRVQTQWRVNLFGQRVSLDYGPAIAICRELKWHVASVLDLLQAVEFEAIESGKGADGE